MSRKKGVNVGAGVPDESLNVEQAVNPELEAMKKQIALLIKQNAEKDEVIELLSADSKAIDKDDAPGTANFSHASTKARYAIVIDESSQPQDAQDVFAAVNGRPYVMQRGVVVEVPPEVVEVLDHAILLKHIPVVDAHGMPNGTITRAVRRFPYRNHGMVVDAAGKRIAA